MKNYSFKPKIFAIALYAAILTLPLAFADDITTKLICLDLWKKLSGVKGKVYLEAGDLIPYRTHAQVAALEKGEPIPAIFIATHQVDHFNESDPLAEATAKLLQEDPRFRAMPRVLLTGDAFRLRSENLFRQASQLRYSRNGEIVGARLNSNIFHFAGGYHDCCLSNSVNHILNQLKDSNIDAVYLTFHSKLIYTMKGSTLREEIESMKNAGGNTTLFELDLMHYFAI